MITKINIGALFLLLLFSKIADGQTLPDTTKMADDFMRVMSFATQPYLFFTTVTRMNAMPPLQEQDTMSIQGAFYKNQTDFYYSNGPEEVYLQDSFMIQINQKRKSIWISRVDIASKDKMNVLPVSNKQLQALFSKNYTITETKLNGLISILNFKARQQTTSSTTVTMDIRLEYFIKDYLPVSMEVEMHIQQPMSDELQSELKNENIDYTKLLQTIGYTKYLVRSQNITVTFSNISNTQEKVTKIPSWKEVLDYGEPGQEFIAKGLYKEYEITKTF